VEQARGPQRARVSRDGVEAFRPAVRSTPKNLPCAAGRRAAQWSGLKKNPTQWSVLITEHFAEREGLDKIHPDLMAVTAVWKKRRPLAHTLVVPDEEGVPLAPKPKLLPDQPVYGRPLTPPGLAHEPVNDMGGLALWAARPQDGLRGDAHPIRVSRLRRVSRSSAGTVAEGAD
jgi:hypothetical protein